MDREKKSLFFPHLLFPLRNRLALTTGEASGVGKKIAIQALKILRPQKNFQFLVWTDDKSKTLQIPPFQTLTFKTSKQALNSPFKENLLLQIKSSGGPGDWLEEAGSLCLKKELSALLTGPISKALVKKNKHRAISQTALLKILCRKKNLFMCFRGDFFNLILFTDHIPLKKISLDKRTFKHLLSLALKARRFLSPSLQNKPLAVLGLNPHAGEGGLIGKEEEKILKPLLKTFSSKEVQGPFSPDSAFLKKNWGLYSFFIALYHDQGLIPFKMIHSHRGFVQTLGLPFLRLGVDHGTGLGLKDSEISSESFLKALKEALRIIRLSYKKSPVFTV